MDWRTIRPLNGGRDKGFEELCAQLARWEVGNRARFIRKGNPDAGVECYAKYGNGSEWAWQAKYFLTLGDSQWTQLDGSVRTALQKHPLLARYMICLPMDLPDARVPGQQAALAKWDARVEKWKEWASARGMTVEFAYWGSSELLERLSKAEHVGRVRFWFDATGFDRDWFARRLKEARDTAGPRYTPEVHVELPIARRFETFGRTSRFFIRTIALIRELGAACSSTCSYGPSRLSKERDAIVEAGITMVSEDAVVCAGRVSIGNGIDEIIAMGSSVEVQPNGTLPFEDVANKIAAVEVVVDGVVQHLLARQPEHPVFSQYRSQFEQFSERLRKTRGELVEAQRWGGAAVMIVSGQAGTGKTHLLCDVAHHRLGEGWPTVLLLGQCFTSDGAPWRQAAELLDASDRSAAEFVGALECAAQAAGVRALVLIDALNEGKGMSVWPTHLPAFLAHFARSDWIGVVLSIRSSYDELIPVAVRENAVVAIHRGFRERSYDAMRTYFTHYGLELPSTPLIATEFDSPLFLKTLCLGLQGQGATRLRQGINGVTAIFELYISSINKRVAKKLALPEWNKAAENALRALVRAFPSVSERWLAVEAAEELVNGVLPGRPFEESLYRMLVVEGVLVEEGSRGDRVGRGREIVFIAYERLADHLLTEVLLDAHFDPVDAAISFEPGGGLCEVAEGGYETQGILEALCIQLPERTGREVVDIVPKLTQGEGFEGAFTQSLVWRDAGTISARTCELVSARLEPEARDRSTILHTLLTLATRPEHPLNARFLDTRLRQDEMAARDAWWSVHLHSATCGGGPARRLLDWALAVLPSNQLGDDLVDLCAISLAWMLAASNLAVRHQATRALVNLLTGRLEAAQRLVEGFACVNDPYVTERVYSVAYGVATRSNDPAKVRLLAECVYAKVFSTGTPPANILLRDYARGVVERALYLKSAIDVDVTRIRPPYESEPPTFPSEDDVQPLLPSPGHNRYRRENEDWARSHIGDSVFGGWLRECTRNTLESSGEWLSLKLDDPAWWKSTGSMTGSASGSSGSMFDGSQIERYVLWRVFDLGWTSERFGDFDRTWDIDQFGWTGKESMGRKYQKIAYREILALISDSYQYREYHDDVEREHHYVGPWQNGLRDIDPTFVGTLPVGSRLSYQWRDSRVWWTVARYDNWVDSDKLGDWVLRQDDLPKIEDLLIAKKPEDGTMWVNGNCYFSLHQQPPVGRSRSAVETGEITWWITGYLTRATDAEVFVEWAKAQRWVDAGIGDVTLVDNVFAGEHGWAPAAQYMQSLPGRLFDASLHNKYGPVPIEAVATEYPFRSDRGDEHVSADGLRQLPAQQIVQCGELHWRGHAADFLDRAGEVAVFDPSVHSTGPSALLLRQDFLKELMSRHGIGIVWTVVCLKSVKLFDPAPGYPLLRISGAYRLSENGLVGFMRPEVRQRQPMPWESLDDTGNV